MIMGDNQHSENIATSSSPTPVIAPLEIVDAQTLVAQNTRPDVESIRG